MSMFSSVNYKTVGTRMSTSSKSFQILSYIAMKGGCSKYEFVKNVLRKDGTRQQLRGYYCVWCETMVKGDILHLENGVYKITELGKIRMFDAIVRSSV